MSLDTIGLSWIRAWSIRRDFVVEVERIRAQRGTVQAVALSAKTAMSGQSVYVRVTS